MKSFDDITVEIDGNIAFVEINRPPNNFFDYLLIQQIADAYEEIDSMPECRIIILSLDQAAPPKVLMLVL